MRLIKQIKRKIMAYKRDYVIRVSADIHDRTYWWMTRKGEPATPSDEDKQVVVTMLREVLKGLTP